MSVKGHYSNSALREKHLSNKQWFGSGDNASANSGRTPVDPRVLYGTAPIAAVRKWLDTTWLGKKFPNASRTGVSLVAGMNPRLVHRLGVNLHGASSDPYIQAEIIRKLGPRPTQAQIDAALAAAWPGTVRDTMAATIGQVLGERSRGGMA
jgi:hypothetical protein